MTTWTDWKQFVIEVEEINKNPKPEPDTIAAVAKFFTDSDKHYVGDNLHLCFR